MAFSLGEYGDIFLEEADEQLQELNQNLVELEKNPEDNDIINNIFRAAHSLKSSAAFVGLNDLSNLAHKMENLLQGIRDKTMEITPEVVNIIFKCFDSITDVIETVSAGEEPHQDLNWLVNEILGITEKSAASSVTQVKAEQPLPVEEVIISSSFEFSDAEISLIKESVDNGKLCGEVSVYIDPSAQMKWVKGQLVMNNLDGIGDIVASQPPVDKLTDEALSAAPLKVILITDKNPEDIKKACDIDLITGIDLKIISTSVKDGKTEINFGNVEKMVMSVSAPVIAVKKLVDIETDDPAGKEKSGSAKKIVISDEEEDEPQEKSVEELDKKKAGLVLKTVKVSIDKLDQLLNNVGELVTANSGFYKLYDELRKINMDKTFTNDFKNRIEQMSRIAKDLQNGIMNTRMVPIGQVFSRFNRLVRDLTKEFGKNIELVVKGEDTELDKKVIDVIGEPLMHLLRNAIDHGIESPDVRVKSGKSETARVTLNAYQSGNQIFVEVSDDGMGLDPAVIKKKALEKGLSTPELIEKMDNSEIYNFIFAPGFSTAAKITDVSGRGVGMNVVMQTVSELNGSVNIETELNMGTRFIMAFPLTLAIIPAIMVRVKKAMYAIPLSDVLDTIKIQSSEITTIEGNEVINFRGEILSIIRLNNFIGSRSALGENQKIPVVVVSFGNRKIGLLVDFLEGKQEIVIKSLEQNYKTVRGLAGASILGDGSICLILDISAMINLIMQNQDRFKSGNLSDDDEEDAEEPVKEIISIKAPEIKKEQAVPDLSASKSVSKEKSSASSIIFDLPSEVAKAPEATVTSGSKIDIFKDETTPVVEAVGSVAAEKKVHDALEQFKNELKSNIDNTLAPGHPGEHMAQSLNLSKNDLNSFQLIANVGAANAADALSKILGKRIDLSIPEVALKPVESIPSILGETNQSYIGVMLNILGDAKGTVLFIFDEKTGFDLVNHLYGTTNTTSELTEDGISALKEITNIVGSSVINVFAEKTGLLIKPSIPNMVHDFLGSIIDSILAVQNTKSDYAIIMDTAFYFENDQIVGNLLIMPEAESLKLMVEKLR
jgi:two-component system chemotaxis sensor kinase CheA